MSIGVLVALTRVWQPGEPLRFEVAAARALPAIAGAATRDVELEERLRERDGRERAPRCTRRSASAAAAATPPGRSSSPSRPT